MKRLRRLAIGFAVLVGVLALIVVAAEAMLHNSGAKKLAEVTGVTDAAEPGWRIDDIMAARQATQPPAGANTAPVVLSLHAANDTEAWKHIAQSDDAVGYGGFAVNTTPEFARVIWLMQAHHVAKGVNDAAVERLLSKEFLKQAGGFYQLTIAENPYATLLPHVQKAREVAYWLALDSRYAALAGHPDRGIRAARAQLVAGRSIGDEPFLISQLVRIACANNAAQSALQVLAWGKPQDGLAELQAEFRTEADFPWLLTGLRGERAIVDKAFADFEAGKLKFRDVRAMVGGSNDNPLEALGAQLYKGLLPGDHAKSLEMLNAYIAAAKLPPHQQLAAFQAIPLPPRPPEEFRYIITSLLLPACQKVTQASLRARAQLLAASTAIACERFRMANGRWPNSLNEIPKSMLPEVPTDPCDGLPLRYQELPDGIAVYSVGVGVELESARQRRRQEGDPLAELGIGWKLWNPEKRGIPIAY